MSSITGKQKQQQQKMDQKRHGIKSLTCCYCFCFILCGKTLRGCLPGAQNTSPSFTSTVLHNGETSLDNIYRTAANMSAKQLKGQAVHTKKTGQSIG